MDQLLHAWPGDILCRWKRWQVLWQDHSVGQGFEAWSEMDRNIPSRKWISKPAFRRSWQPWHWKTLVQWNAIYPVALIWGYLNESHKSQVMRMWKHSSFSLDGFCCGTWHLQAGRVAKQLRCRQWMESGFGTAVVWQFLAALIGECGGSSLRPLAASMPAVRTGTAAIDRVPKYQTPWLRIFRGYSALSHSALDSSLVGVLVLQRHIACADMFCIRKIKDSIVR